MGHAATPALALRDLRRARHHRHREDVDWVETLYRVYVTVLSAIAIIWLSASRVTDAAAGGDGQTDIRRYGAAVLGLAVAFLVALGLRSGSRGGPLSLEGADVRIVLLAPIGRQVALRAPALRQLRSAAFSGLCVGAVVGNLAGQRLPGEFIGWVAAGAGFGLLAAVLSTGAALVACGLRIKRPLATGLGVAALAWSAADLIVGASTSSAAGPHAGALAVGTNAASGMGHTAGFAASADSPAAVISPFTLLGRIALAALPGDVRGGSPEVAIALGLVLAAAVLIVAAGRLGHMSLEAAEHRGRLAAQLRFALSLQDLRAVVLLRRRLAAEEPRPRPWVRLRDKAPAAKPAVEGDGVSGVRRGWSRIATSLTGSRPARPRAGWRDPVSVGVRRRGWQSVLRWPLPRILRVCGLGVVAGFAAGGAWEGTTPLVIVAGAALFVAALDALEPLAQEMDHPGRRDSFPIAPARLVSAAVFVPTVVLTITTLLGVGVAIAVLGVPANVMILAAIPATAGAVAGGTASLVLEPVSAAELMSRYPVPEAAGPMLVARLGFAPGLAISGWLPLLAGRAALNDGFSPGAGVFQSGIALVGLSVLVVRALTSHFERKRAVPAP